VGISKDGVVCHISKSGLPVSLLPASGYGVLIDQGKGIQLKQKKNLDLQWEMTMKTWESQT
jgi:hypothetical protein